MQKLSIEYARLVRENERLRGVIQSAVNMLQDSTTKEFKKGKLLFVKIHIKSIFMERFRPEGGVY